MTNCLEIVLSERQLCQQATLAHSKNLH